MSIIMFPRRQQLRKAPRGAHEYPVSPEGERLLRSFKSPFSDQICEAISVMSERNDLCKVKDADRAREIFAGIYQHFTDSMGPIEAIKAATAMLVNAAAVVANLTEDNNGGKSA
jgi:hypothetical protein